MPSFIEIGGSSRKFSKKLVDLTQNDPNVRSVGKLTADLIAINKCGSDIRRHSHNTRQEPREATRRVNNATITRVPRHCIQIGGSNLVNWE